MPDAVTILTPQTANWNHLQLMWFSLAQLIFAFDAEQQKQQLQQAKSHEPQQFDLPSQNADAQSPHVSPLSSQPVPVLTIKPIMHQRDSENVGMSLFMGYYNEHSCASSILSPLSNNTSCSSASGSASAPDLASLDPSLLPHSVPQSQSFSFSLSESRDLQSSHQSQRMITRPVPAQCRRNEHLAIFISRTLWKPDRLAGKCDKYTCKVKFSFWERKHHCRKCGGIYCRACSARTTPLLDTSNLPFLLPPRDTSIHQFASPTAPVYKARVCDECYDQIHGFKITLRSPASSEEEGSSSRSASRTSTTSTPKSAVPFVNSYSSLSILSPSTPPDDMQPNIIPRAPTKSPCHRTYNNPDWPDPPVVKTTKLEGDLDRYPLKDPSQTCKAAGGFRWDPKQYSPRWDSRLPDGRLRYEVEAERIEEEERVKLANPVIVDGPIRVRRPQTIPAPSERRPQRYQLPTF